MQHDSQTVRRLGRTGLQVFGIALGTVELGLDYGIPAPGHFGRPHVEDAIRLVHAALDHGITLIDTARAYGASEDGLGQALAGRRHRVVLATKVSTQGADGVSLAGVALCERMLTTLDASLAALRTDWVDIWQIHNVDRALLDQHELVAEVVDQVRRAGKVRWFGGSFYGADLPLAALATGLFDTLQITYSALDQRLADAVLPAAAAQDVGILARSVLLKGALTERAEHLPDRLDALRQRSRQFRRLVAESGLNLTPAQAAVAFALAQPQIQAVLVGVRTVDELEENVRAANAQLPSGLVAAMHGLRLDDEDLLNPGTWGIP